MALYEEGDASLADIDKTISVGPGLRWSFMGLFETIELNASDAFEARREWRDRRLMALAAHKAGQPEE
jgi:3-hydroxyacyl-CoA dehydrogenase